MSGEALVGFAAVLAEALAGIHEAGVVHRDLTPSNVLLAADGPKVVDFGIARALHQAALTATGTVMGTPGWVPPEVARGGEHSPAGDVFCWGALVAHAACGRPPFGTGPAEAVMFRVVHESPDVPALPPPLADLVAFALAKDPAQRPSANRILAGILGGPQANGAAATTDVVQLLARTWRLPPDLHTVEAALPSVPRRRRLALVGLAAVLLLLGVLLSGAAAVGGLLPAASASWRPRNNSAWPKPITTPLPSRGNPPQPTLPRHCQPSPSRHHAQRRPNRTPNRRRLPRTNPSRNLISQEGPGWKGPSRQPQRQPTGCSTLPRRTSVSSSIWT